MQRETKKPRVKLVRTADGSLRPAGSATKESKTDDLKNAWAAQDNFLSTSNTTFKQELSRANKWAKKSALFYKNKLKYKKFSLSKSTKYNKLTHYFTKRNIGIAMGIILIFVAGTLLIGGNDDNKGESKVAGEIETVDIETGVTPSFPVLSIDGSGDVPGGYARINPPGSPNTYAYVDSLDGIPIKVSQQKAPDSVLADASKIQDLAVQFGATESFDAGELTIYIGKSANGPQSILYTKGGLLVLIAADQPISNSTWIEYISNLRF
jgi:hypothetical protein